MNEGVRKGTRDDDAATESANVEAGTEISVDVDPESDAMRGVDESVERAAW